MGYMRNVEHATKSRNKKAKVFAMRLSNGHIEDSEYNKIANVLP